MPIITFCRANYLSNLTLKRLLKKNPNVLLVCKNLSFQINLLVYLLIHSLSYLPS